MTVTQQPAEARPTHRTAIDPWTWQQALGYSQGLLVEAPHRTLHLSGQCSVGPDKSPLHAGDMAGQAQQAMAHVEAVLAAAGLTLADVVRYDVYTTDLDRYLQSGHQHVAGRFAGGGPFPAGGICAQVERLAMPGLLVEVVATAAR
jgi:enamine deaminase RidA (YjgF/YER057c/UK114 family)